MTLGARITHGHEIRSRYLALERKFIVLGIRQSILVVKSWRAADGAKGIEEICQVVIRENIGRILRREVFWRIGGGEQVLDRCAGGPIGKRSRKTGSKLAGVVAE